MARSQRLSKAQIAELFDPPAEQRELVRHFRLSPADIAAVRHARQEWDADGRYDRQRRAEDLTDREMYPSGVARGQPDLARSSRQYCRIVFVDFDQIDQVFDAEVGERHLALVVDPLDPDHSVLGLHFNGYIEQPVFVFAKFPGDAGYRFDVMDFVDVHGQAA